MIPPGLSGVAVNESSSTAVGMVQVAEAVLLVELVSVLVVDKVTLFTHKGVAFAA